MRHLKNKHKLQVDWVESGKYLAGRETKYLKNLDALANIVAGVGEKANLLTGKNWQQGSAHAIIKKRFIQQEQC